ncbi:MAG: tripartite tricarboxylate transporter TctB family protein [Gammaproteobacteria bacterium]
MEQSSSNRTSLAVAIFLLIVSISVLVTAYDFRGGSGIFPRFIGWIFVGLTLLECLVQLKANLSPSALIAINDNALVKNKIIKEFQGIFWLIVFLIFVYLTGFLIGIPLYIFSFLRLSAKKHYKQCIIISATATILVYVLFIQLLQYRLYQGILFGS